MCRKLHGDGINKYPDLAIKETSRTQLHILLSQSNSTRTLPKLISLKDCTENSPKIQDLFTRFSMSGYNIAILNWN